jgi:hypothetical protein
MLNHWGFYIPTEEYKYTRIPCEELLYPYINIDFSKPSRTFELIHTGEIVEHSYHDLKIHIVWDEEVYEKIYTLISETEKPFMERVGNAFEYEGEVDFETMCFDILEKGYGKHIYHVSFYKDGEKAYPSTIDEQDMDALIIFEVFMYKLLSEEDKAKVELREHSKLLLEFPLVFEFYGPRVLLDEAELSKIGVCSLKNVVEYMTPRLKRGDYGVPIKRKIAYFLISCRDNYVPPEIWGEQAEAVASLQQQIQQIGYNNTLPYKHKQSTMTRKARRVMFDMPQAGDEEKLLDMIKRHRTRKGGRNKKFK